ncbi:hypothetical protein ABEH63_26020, partial [Pseudomonas syringae]
TGPLALAGVFGVGEGHLFHHRKARRLVSGDFAKLGSLFQSFLSSDDISEIERLANELIAHDDVIKSYTVFDVEDARMWSYQGIEIPCGGTHLVNPSAIGRLNVRRKRLGKGKERLICDFPNAEIDLSPYHERALR